MAMTPVKIPPTWKADLVALRDSLDEELGRELLKAIAALASSETGLELLEQLPALAEALRASPRNTLEAIAAVVEGEAPTAAAGVASTALLTPTVGGEGEELDRLMNRPVPYGLVGLVSRLLDVAATDPAKARAALVRTCQWL